MITLHTPAYDRVHLDRLFQNILEDDIPCPGAKYPEGYKIQYPRDLSVSGYRICWQLLKKGVDLMSFRRLVLSIILKGGTESADQRQHFKYVRAHFKHLRFACANFDRRHRYPWSLNLVTSLMGHMQDAFKNHQTARTRMFGIALFLTTLPVFYTLVRFQVRIFQPDDCQGVFLYHKKENDEIENIITKKDITANDFHDLRKIISRRVAFNDTLRVLYPSEYLDEISRYLSDINGEMGDLHDGFIKKKMCNASKYKTDIVPLNKNLISKINALGPVRA